MDAFSEILSGVKLNGAVFFSAEFSAPWGFSAPPTSVISAELAPGAAHLVLYHFVIAGGALVDLLDGRSMETHARGYRHFPSWASAQHDQRPRRASAISELRHFE
jgi:hypothetical protein